MSFRELTRRVIHRSLVAAYVASSVLFVPSLVDAKGPTLVLHRFEVRTAGSPSVPPIHRRIALAAPQGWTRASDPRLPELELVGPEGVGRMLVFAGLHPSQLGPVLDRLRRDHPSAAPSPPEPMKLPGLRPELEERATRFAITGREVGEMVMLEKHDTILLIVTVVTPEAWPGLAPVLAKVYPTVTINDVRRDSSPKP